MIIDIREHGGVFGGGKYRIGSRLKLDFEIIEATAGMGTEIWAKTDVSNGYGIAVDNAGNVYVAHGVSSGSKTVRKLDANGNEIWSKTDVTLGQGIAVDSVGNVYVTHDISSGSKVVRKLDGNKYYQIVR